MIRSSRADTSGRAFRMFMRATVEKVNDGPQMQEVDVNLFQDEKKEGVERWQNYGFSSVPKGPEGKKYAEAIVAFLGGNRSHGVVLGIDDRRFRPKNLKAGESVQYDDEGKQVLLSRDGIKIRTGDSKKPVDVEVDGNKFTMTKDKIELKVGDNVVKLDSTGFYCNGHKIDHTHKHKDVMPGGGLTGTPE